MASLSSIKLPKRHISDSMLCGGTLPRASIFLSPASAIVSFLYQLFQFPARGIILNSPAALLHCRAKRIRFLKVSLSAICLPLLCELFNFCWDSLLLTTPENKTEKFVDLFKKI